MSWYKKANQLIDIHMEDYKISLLKLLNRYVLSSQQQKDKVLTNTVEKNQFISILNSLNYPNYLEIINNINNITSDIYKKFEEWFWDSYLYGDNKNNIDFRQNGRFVLESMQSLSQSLYSSDFTEKDAKDLFEQLLGETYKLQQENQVFLGNIIESISGFNTYVIISPTEVDKDYDFQKGEGDSYVYLNNIENGPMFSLFVMDNNIVVEDVYDAAEDDDMFIDNKIKQDYYQLVNKIKNRGKEQKPIWLYTARPVKDRQIYQNTNQIPSNIYLTTSYNRVEGIALELSGNEKYRDIWKIKINPQYLIETYDGSSFKDFQTIGEKIVPIIDIKLISEGF